MLNFQMGRCCLVVTRYTLLGPIGTGSRHTPVIVEFDQNTELEDDLHIARGCVQCDVAVRLGADALMLTFASIQGARAALENLE